MAGIPKVVRKVQLTVKVTGNPHGAAPTRVDRKVTVPVPKTEAQLAKSMTTVLKKALVPSGYEGTFNMVGLGREMAAAALKGGTVRIEDPKGRKISMINVDKKDPSAGLERAVQKMERHLGFEVVDQAHLSEQLAFLAKGAKTNK